MKNGTDRRATIFLCIALMIPVMWAALLAAPFLTGGLPEIVGNLAVALNHPFDICWVPDTPKCILLFIGAYSFGLGIYFSTRRNYRHREEHGCSTMIKTVGLRHE